LLIPCPSSRSRLAHGVVHLAREEETEETEATILPVPFEDIAVDAEELEPLATSLASLAAGRNDEEADVFTLDNPLDNPVEDADEDEEDNVLDDDEDEED
jgi:hypothetical protein